jgi:hypothetical protein
MARKFFYGETLNSAAPITSRLGLVGAPYKDTEIGKLVKGTTESGHILCAAGDQIGGRIAGVENATSDGFGIGTVDRNNRMSVVADGVQATPGTGTIALGDQVVCGTVVAKDTALGATNARVCKATIQVGAVPADVAAAGVQLALVATGNIWKVVSLGSAASGAVGTDIVIERAFRPV